MYPIKETCRSQLHLKYISIQTNTPGKKQCIHVTTIIIS
jgi:hypothetical protein